MSRAISSHERVRACIVLAVVAIAARGMTFGNPAIGFDEQYYLLVGDRMLHGALPYVDIWDRKPIGLFLIYAVIRLLGGDGVVQYQLVAAVAAWATALVVWRLARRPAGGAGALAAAGTYLLWLDFTEGEGGQSAVFYNLPMALAATLVATVVAGCARPRRAGAAAMLLCGVAIQIKYSAVFEGVFFGLALLWSAWRRSTSLRGLVGRAALFAGLALVPTALALLFYWQRGALDAFVFANFLSLFGKSAASLQGRALGWLIAVAITSPLWIAALLVRGREPIHGRAFAWCWLVAAIVGLIPFVTGGNPNSLPPLLLPLTLLAAPALGRSRIAAAALLLVAFLGGQAVLRLGERQKGTAAQARGLIRAAVPRRGCLFVYDGYPSLYTLTGSCLPTRYAFPGLLNTRSEDHVAAIGVSPEAEVARILSRRPEKIADVQPAFSRGNARTRAIVDAALRRDYRLTYAVRTGSKRRLVYTRRDVLP